MCIRDSITGLAECVKKNIYEKANNILLLSIIEAIGMNYQKEMPGLIDAVVFVMWKSL